MKMSALLKLSICRKKSDHGGKILQLLVAVVRLVDQEAPLA